VLSNLIGNASKFTPEEGVIHVSARRKGREILISVSDNGPGIPPEALPKIFDRYWQAEKSGKAGSGLGLSIAKGLVEAHGGRIWVESAVGKGCTFHFTVPLSKTVRGELQPALPLAGCADGTKSLEGLRVMIVDDSSEFRFIMNRVLVKAGAEVIESDDVDDAISKLRQQRPNVILSDIEMPGKNGFDLIEAIRQMSSAEGGDIPVAAITGHVGERARKKIEEAGFDMDVVKDDFDKIVEAVVTLGASPLSKTSTKREHRLQ
jgi:two-component system CheB/CheR fusion protein